MLHIPKHVILKMVWNSSILPILDHLLHQKPSFLLSKERGWPRSVSSKV